MFDFMDFDPASTQETYSAEGPNVPEAADCMRCGVCLSSCPTYQLDNDEQEGPRQRIRTLSKLVLEGQEVDKEALAHLSNCLQCRACEAVCPSQMDYADLYEQAQQMLDGDKKRGIYAQLALKLIAHKSWFNRLLPLVRFYQFSGLRTLLRWSRLLNLLGLARADRYAGKPAMTALKPCYPVSGARGSVALFTGCISDRFDRDTLLAAITVLNHIGFSVQVPKQQVCCGAIHYHNGEADTGRQLLRSNQDVFTDLNVDAIVYCATGCGVQLQEAEQVLQQEDNDTEKFTGKLFEICDFVDRHWPETLNLQANNSKIVVHEPCSQRNVLRQQQAVYRLLERVPEMTVTALAENNLCCGAGGSYMLTHPENADALRDRKWQQVLQSEADCLVSANIGCALHLATAEEAGEPISIKHPISVIAGQLTR